MSPARPEWIHAMRECPELPRRQSTSSEISWDFQLAETSPCGTDQFDWALLRTKGAELMLNAAPGTRSAISPVASHQSMHLDVRLHFG
jgi:hypothetical protein